MFLQPLHFASFLEALGFRNWATENGERGTFPFKARLSMIGTDAVLRSTLFEP